MNTQHFLHPGATMRQPVALSSSLPHAVFTSTAWKPLGLFMLLLVLWFLMPAWLTSIDETTGSVDQGIWLLILLSLLCFLLILGLCWWLLQNAWLQLGLPSIQKMVSHFNLLDSWQQLLFYWGSFFSLLLAASIIISAIC